MVKAKVIKTKGRPVKSESLLQKEANEEVAAQSDLSRKFQEAKGLLESAIDRIEWLERNKVVSDARLKMIDDMLSVFNNTPSLNSDRLRDGMESLSGRISRFIKD